MTIHFRLRPFCLDVLALALAGCQVNVGGFTDLVATVKSAAKSGPDPSVHTLARAACAAPLAASPAGHVYFRLAPQDHVYRMEARANAPVQDLSAALDAFGAGTDVFVGASANGRWLLVGTTRFGCGDEACAVVVSSDLCSAQVVFSQGVPIAPDATSVVSSDGDLVVYPGQGGPHRRDLFAVRRQGTGWSAPVVLTKASPYPYHQQPYLSADGTKVTMDCGPNGESGPETNICEATTDGASFRVTVTSDLVPPGSPPHAPGNLLQESSYEANGGIVFEASYDGAEQIWRLAPGAAYPTLVNNERTDDGSAYRYTNDNGPCVLPDGRIVSLWLGRAGSGAGSASGHEIKVMNADGSNSEMLLVGENVDDIGIFCTE